MLKIENDVVGGWEAAIRGMRNPKNSWEKSDSTHKENCEECIHRADYTVCKYNPIHECLNFKVGPNDYDLMTRLRNAGTDHRKFLRMIAVYTDIVAPLYWWKEYDTYKVGTVANSCSTMHKIAEKEFTKDDFSHEHITDAHVYQLLLDIIESLNEHRKWYNIENDPIIKKHHWWQMIQLLPSSYNQRRTVMLNYEVLANIYHARRNHKLDEWHTFCDWIESLPYSELITGKKSKQEEKKEE